MIFTETPLAGAFVVTREPREDERGAFARAWCQREFAAQGIDFQPVQANLSSNRLRGTLRGMHYQAAPYEEIKLVNCIRGAIYDVIVDVRPASPTYKHWFGVELSESNQHMLYIPKGFAHGFQTLEDDTTLYYLMGAFYEPEAGRGLRWNDPAIGIQWRFTDPLIIAEKDQQYPDFAG